MTTPQFTPAGKFLPHTGEMMLMDTVISHTAKRTECIIDVATSTLFHDADGSVPSWLALEYMAQAIAVHGGLVDADAGRPNRPGLLLGSRNLQINVDRFKPGQRLRAEVLHRRGDIGMLAFECALFDENDGDTKLAGGAINVFLLESFEALLEGFDNAH